LAPETLETTLYTAMNWDDACLQLTYKQVRELAGKDWKASRPTRGAPANRSFGIEAEKELAPIAVESSGESGEESEGLGEAGEDEDEMMRLAEDLLANSDDESEEGEEEDPGSDDDDDEEEEEEGSDA
jgi:hypothetical protein